MIAVEVIASECCRLHVESVCRHGHGAEAVLVTARGERGADLFGPSGCGDVPVGHLSAKQSVTHGATDDVRGMAVRPQRLEDRANSARHGKVGHPADARPASYD